MQLFMSTVVYHHGCIQFQDVSRANSSPVGAVGGLKVLSQPLDAPSQLILLGLTFGLMPEQQRADHDEPMDNTEQQPLRAGQCHNEKKTSRRLKKNRSKTKDNNDEPN
jgi:hypothetical protein